MNERIEKLAKAYLVHERYTRYGESVEEDLYEFYPDELQKFAELIVQECAMEAIDEVAFQGGSVAIEAGIRQRLYTHFAVEE